MFLEKTRDYLRRNGRDVTIFVLSLLLAFNVWLVYSLTLNYTMVVSVPVVAVSNLSGHKQLSSNTNVVMARCHTRGLDLLRLEYLSDRKAVQVRISSSDLKCKGGEIFYLTATELNKYVEPIFGTKAGMELFVTDSLFFHFPFENSKKVPVHPTFSMSCHPQYMAVGGMKMTPDSVVVYGQPSIIDKIDRIYTKSFDLRDLKAPAHGEVKLDQVNGVRMSQDYAEYMVRVQRYVEISATMPIKTRNVPPNKELVIYPSSAKVLFRCMFPVTVNPETAAQFYIDYNDFASTLKGVCLPKLDEFPEGLLDYVMEPQSFECVESDR